MGCDIHAHLEVKMEDKWRHYSDLDIQRNYKLFALMANVRNYDLIDPVDYPKGLPDNLTYITEKHYKAWEADAHSASWFGVEDLIALKERYESIVGDISFFYREIFGTFLFGHSLTGWYEYPDDDTIGIEDIRLIFWFDN